MLQLRLFSLYLLLIPIAHLSAQIDTAKVGMVIVDSTQQGIDSIRAVSLPPPPVRKDLYRNKMMLRLPLQHPHNRPLQQARWEGSPNRKLPPYQLQLQGLVLELIEGLRTEKLRARHPQKPKQAYTYFDLVYDLMEMEGLDPQSLDQDYGVEELGWEWFNQYVDLVVDEGFSKQNSRPYLEVQFIRLLYFDPNSTKGLHVMAIFSYAQVAKILREMHYPAAEGGPFELRLFEFINFRKFQSQVYTSVEDPALFLPPLRRSEAALRTRWPELWRY